MIGTKHTAGRQQMEFEGTKRIAPELNIAPLVDVVFLLLIFFMLTSTLLERKMIEVDLPLAGSAASSSELAPVTITLRGTSEIFLNGEISSQETLANELANFKNPEALVLIRSDQAVQVQTLVSVIDTLRDQNFSNISLETIGRN